MERSLRATLHLPRATSSLNAIRSMSLRLPRHAINLRSSCDSLAQLLGPAGTTALAFVTVPDFPGGWTVIRVLPNSQMVWNSVVPPPVKHGIEDLNISHIDEMLALTEL